MQNFDTKCSSKSIENMGVSLKKMIYQKTPRFRKDSITRFL